MTLWILITVLLLPNGMTTLAPLEVHFDEFACRTARARPAPAAAFRECQLLRISADHWPW